MSTWVTPAFDATAFTATAFPPTIPAPTWVVDAGDVSAFAVRLIGKTMTLAFHLVGTSVVDGPPVTLVIRIPYGRLAKRTVTVIGYVSDNGTARRVEVTAASGGASLVIRLADSGGNFANSANNTTVSGQIEFEVMTATDTTAA